MAEQYKLKLIVLGEQGVGKTSLLVRYTDGTFRDKYKCTAVDRYHKSITLDNTRVMLELWDTAGMDRFRACVRGYFRGSDGVLLIYDVTDITTFNKLESWLQELGKENETACIIIVGNKCEDLDRKMVTKRAVESSFQSYARSENVEYIETSAKTGDNVNEAFEILTRKILEVRRSAVVEGPSTSNSIDESEVNDADVICLSAANDTDFTKISTRITIQELPPLVPLPDDSIIKLCVEKDKLRNENDDLCCAIS